MCLGKWNGMERQAEQEPVWAKVRRDVSVGVCDNPWGQSISGPPRPAELGGVIQSKRLAASHASPWQGPAPLG